MMNDTLFKIVTRVFPGLTLPEELRWKRNLTTEEILLSYLDDPSVYWKGVARRHIDKINKTKSELAKLGYTETKKLSAALIDLVKASKKNNLDRPIFVMGAGGSGTTWLGAMLGDVSGYRYGREIYIPPTFSELYRKYHTDEMNEVIWAIMILHAWGLHNPSADFQSNFVNSGRSIFDYDIFKKIWPNGHFIFLVRDPRDQILSVTHRKQNYRNSLAPEMTDRMYFQKNTKQLKKTYKRYMDYANEEIMLVKYEDLFSNTQDELKSISNRFSLTWSQDEFESIAYRHNAKNIRNGHSNKIGNLDEGGESNPWSDLMTTEERKQLYPFIQEMLETYGYEKDDSWIYK